MLKRSRRAQGVLHSISRSSEILNFQLIASNPVAGLGDDSIVSISVRLGKLSFFCPLCLPPANTNSRLKAMALKR